MSIPSYPAVSTFQNEQAAGSSPLELLQQSRKTCIGFVSLELFALRHAESIGDFTQLCERMSPAETYAFVNDYPQRIRSIGRERTT